MKTKIVIVRHAETLGNIEDRLTGRQDYELTETGKYEIAKLTQELRNIKFNRIYSSLTERTVKTVEPLAKINHLNIEKKEELSEMYFGKYDGWKWAEVNRIQPEIKQKQIKINEISGIPGQETMEETAERMYRTIEILAKENIGKTILISSHGIAIEAFLRAILNKKFCEERTRFRQYNAAINKLFYENEKFVITKMADVSYLNKGEKNEFKPINYNNSSGI